MSQPKSALVPTDTERIFRATEDVRLSSSVELSMSNLIMGIPLDINRQSGVGRVIFHANNSSLTAMKPTGFVAEVLPHTAPSDFGQMVVDKTFATAGASLYRIKVSRNQLRSLEIMAPDDIQNRMMSVLYPLHGLSPAEADAQRASLDKMEPGKCCDAAVGSWKPELGGHGAFAGIYRVHSTDEYEEGTGEYAVVISSSVPSMSKSLVSAMCSGVLAQHRIATLKDMMMHSKQYAYAAQVGQRNRDVLAHQLCAAFKLTPDTYIRTDTGLDAKSLVPTINTPTDYLEMPADDNLIFYHSRTASTRVTGSVLCPLTPSTGLLVMRQRVGAAKGWMNHAGSAVPFGLGRAMSENNIPANSSFKRMVNSDWMRNAAFWYNPERKQINHRCFKGMYHLRDDERRRGEKCLGLWRDGKDPQKITPVFVYMAASREPQNNRAKAVAFD